MPNFKEKIVDVTCAIILNKQELVLVAQRSATMSLPLKWELPGGKIESGETSEECIIREIKEELNIEISIINSLSSNKHDYPTVIVNLIPFICNYEHGDVLLREHAAFKWMNKEELLNLDWADADIPIIHNYLSYINDIT